MLGLPLLLMPTAVATPMLTLSLLFSYSAMLMLPLLLMPTAVALPMPMLTLALS